MKRVLVIVYTPTYGGPHNQIVELYKPLLELGWETVALLPEADKDSYKKFLNKGIKVVTHPLKRLRAKNIFKNNFDYIYSFTENVESIKKIIIKENIDVVQVCGLMHVHAAFACRALHVPLVWQFLGTFAPLPLRMLYTPFASYFADWIMTTGERTAKQHVFHRLFKKKHTIFYPPVDTNKFTFTNEKRIKARKWMNVPDEAFLIGTVGNQNKTKRHEYLIDIAEKLHSEDNVYFRIVGKYTPSHAKYYRKQVIEKAKKKKLMENGYLNILEDDLSIDTIMAGFDAFLLTSRIEGMPTVVLEAMSIGLPVITNEVGSIREVITTGRNGYIYSTVDDACNIILRLKKDRVKYEKICSLNKSETRKKYDISVCAENHKEVYNKILKG